MVAADDVEASLRRMLGDDAVQSDEAERDYYAHDIAGRGTIPPSIIATPRNIADACEIVRLTVQAGRAIVPRGGGMSYTGGYQAAEDGAVLLDMRALDRIDEIAEKDGYVIIEAGCTWAALYDALAERGLRTPFFGPLSGVAATVGGALSQNAAFFGSCLLYTSPSPRDV
jgi:FAD/FMN-containing dehydrogenase